MGEVIGKEMGESIGRGTDIRTMNEYHDETITKLNSREIDSYNGTDMKEQEDH